MNFSKRSRYGIRALIDLAQAGDGGCTQLSDIAARNHIPAKYLEQIFIALRKAGILGSVKGPQGGYFLEDNTRKLSIADIVLALDGARTLEPEASGRKGTGEARALAVQDEIIDPLNRYTEQFLNALTLEKPVESSEKKSGGYAGYVLYLAKEKCNELGIHNQIFTAVSKGCVADSPDRLCRCCLFDHTWALMRSDTVLAQTYRYIIIPQTLRRLIPLSINLITRMIKTTSLILMIGVVEVLKVAQQVIEANRMASPNAAFGVYLAVFLLYFIACWPISMFAKYLEKRWR